VRAWSALLVCAVVGCGTDVIEPVNGPGVAACFPGGEVVSTHPVEPVVVRTGDGLSVLRWNPEPELSVLSVGRPVTLLLSADATGTGVLALSPSNGGHVEILRIGIEPTVSVSSLGIEPNDPAWIAGAPARDGQSFFVLRSPSDSVSTVVLERRLLADASLIASATLPDSVAAARASALAVPAEASRVLLTAAWAANMQEGTVTVIDPVTLERSNSVLSKWALSIRPSPDGGLFSPLNAGLAEVDPESFEPIA